jgi:predicted alpha/beta superfamily hydrolase
MTDWRWSHAVLLGAVLLASAAGAQQRVEIPDTERHVLQSAIVDEEFKVHVYLPRGYEESTEALPVVYLLDAEYSFGGVAYIVRRLIKDELIPPMVVVGVAYEIPYDDYYQRRQRDFTPTRAHLDEFPAAGHAEAFARFMRDELIPFVNRTYRVDPDDRTIMGLSFSGLFSTYALFAPNRIFHRYVIVSPSLWWDGGFMFRQEVAYRAQTAALPARVFLAAGADDGPTIVRDLRRLEGLLAERQYDGLEYQVRFFPDETHRTVFPIAVSHGLRFVFR